MIIQKSQNPIGRAILVAKYFIKKNEKDNKGLTKLKLQKLLYYSQAWNLVFNKEKLFPNQIEAWIHGPVVPEVWQEFKDFDFSVMSHPEISEKEFDCLTENEKGILNDVWSIYGRFNGEHLEALTHNELPWQEARKDISESEPSKNIISIEAIQQYYSAKLKEVKGDGA